MIRRRFPMDGMHPLMQMLLLTSLTLIFMFLFTMLAMFLVRPLFGITTIDIVLQNALTNTNGVAMNANQVNAIKLLQFMSSLGGFFVPAILFALLKFPGGDFLRLRRKFTPWLLPLAALVLAFAGPFISFTYLLNQQLDLPAFLDPIEKMIRDSADSNEKLTSLFLKMPTVADLFINLIVVAVIPAIAEELFFRGCVQQVMKEWLKNAHIAIWITAFIFSFIHFEFYGFVPRMLLGGLLGYLFYWSGNLWVPIIAHGFINGGQIVLAYLHEHGSIQFDIAGDDALPAYAIIICTFLLAGLLFLFRKVSDRRKFIF
ncbi:MAG: CPBP family intramembrane metalloprotease [Chitinophagaceae bacterium]|nr:CPBP family intramembrane metalloprotease [Chitinophagaceae bacterium]